MILLPQRLKKVVIISKTRGKNEPLIYNFTH